MKIKRVLLPIGVFVLFGMSAGLMAKSINSSNDIKQVKADTADVTISTDAEFAKFISAVNGGTRYDNKLVQLAADVSYEITVKPTAEDPYSIFAGTFDGLNHTITITVNLKESMPSLFRNLGNGNFKNAVFKNTNINYSITSCLTTGNVYAAPVATYNNGLIQNVHSTISYDEKDVTYVGGIVEKNQAIGIIEDCSVNGSIRAKGYIGGIASENLGIIRNCVNNCALTNVTGEYVGGIVAINGTNGFVKAIIINCVNNANISSSGTDLGGIAGFQYSNSETSYCDNYGNITSTSTTSGVAYGGIIGRINGADSNADHATKVEYCYNAGNLSTIRTTGGIIGMVNKGATPAVQVSGCFTTGNVGVSTQYGGTLIGWSNSNNLSLNDTRAAGAKSGVTTLGIGGGSAKDTPSSIASSIADGVSDDFRAIIKMIREYNCEAIPGFSTLYNGLDDNEKDILNRINYYDILNTYEMKTYGQAAEYIIGDQAHRAMIFLLNFDNDYSTIIVAISAIVLPAISLVFVIRKKKHVASK